MLGLVVGDGGDVVRIDGEEPVQETTVMATVTEGASSLLSMIITINAASPSCCIRLVADDRAFAPDRDRMIGETLGRAGVRGHRLNRPFSHLRPFPAGAALVGLGRSGSVRCEGVRFRAVVARRQDGSRTGQSAPQGNPLVTRHFERCPQTLGSTKVRILSPHVGASPRLCESEVPCAG